MLEIRSNLERCEIERPARSGDVTANVEIRRSDRERAAWLQLQLHFLRHFDAAISVVDGDVSEVREEVRRQDNFC